MNSYHVTVHYETRGRDLKQTSFAVQASDGVKALSLGRTRIWNDRRRRVWRVTSISAVPTILAKEIAL